MARPTACRCRRGRDRRCSRAGQPPARSRPARARAALADRTLARWLASELLANAAWAGTLVYAGALFAESYGTSPKLTGCLLAFAAGAYVAGNLTCRRLVRRDPRRILVAARRPPRRHRQPLRTCAFGCRHERGSSLEHRVRRRRAHAVASAFALATPPELRPAVTSLRAATMQFGYFAGSIAGGAALTIGGYGAFGAAMGLFFLGAAATLARRPAADDLSLSPAS